MTKTYDMIYAMVSRIPAGRVATYGQIARLVGRPRGARQVGYALAALDNNTRVPWHRVINAKGEISLRAGNEHHQYQRILLEDEGIEFDAHGRTDLARYQWRKTIPKGPMDDPH